MSSIAKWANLEKKDWSKLRHTLDEGPRSKFLGTNLDRFEANWILELDYTLVPSLILDSPNQELSF
jgi:hypothetical protein